jgi:hypothetical protein
MPITESLARLSTILLTFVVASSFADRDLALPSATGRQPEPMCLRFRYAASANRDAGLFPAGVQFSWSDSVVRYWWDPRTPESRELERATRGVGEWRRIGPDSIRATVATSLSESYMLLDFVVTRDRSLGAVRTHSFEDSIVPLIASRVSCRTHQP